jgi:hypothetical protein
MSEERPFSTGWCALAVAVYVAIELVIGHLIGPLIVGAYVSPMLHFEVMTGMHLAAFLVGGILIGVVSPGVRIVEAGVGAFISVALTMTFALFMPGRFLDVPTGKLLLAGGIAFALAVAGAWTGERWMGNVAD